MNVLDQYLVAYDQCIDLEHCYRTLRTLSISAIVYYLLVTILAIFLVCPMVTFTLNYSFSLVIGNDSCSF